MPAPPLSDPGQIPLKQQTLVMQQYAEDVGKYNKLARRHNDLSAWFVDKCLSGK